MLEATEQEYPIHADISTRRVDRFSCTLFSSICTKELTFNRSSYEFLGRAPGESRMVAWLRIAPCSTSGASTDN